MKFDIDSARKAGYSDDEIADYLATENKFDLSGAIESGYSARDVIDFLAKPAASPQRELPADITPSAGRSATPMGQADPRIVDNRGIIQRVSDYLKPAPKSVMEGYVPTPDELQADVDRRLSYGAGPISSQTAAQADLVRSGMAKTDSPTVKKVAKAMEEQGAPSFGDLIERAKSPVNERAARDAKAEEFRAPGEWAVDTLSNLGQGVTGLVQMPVNIIAPSSGVAEILRETQKELQAAESDVLKANRERLKERVLSEDGFFDRYVATVKELVTNPTLSISEAAKQVPNFLGIVGAARLAGAAAGGTVALAGRASPTVALGEAISGGAIQTAARAAGVTAGGAGASMIMAGGDAAGSVYETLTSKDPEVLAAWKKNADYQRLLADKIESGMDRKDASREAIEELATTKARMAALITAPLGLLGYAGAEAAIASKGLGRATAEALTARGMAKTAAKDLAGEQLEEGGTQFGGNVISKTVNPNQSLTEGVPEAMGTALVTSAPFAAAGVRSQYKEAMQGNEDQTIAARVGDMIIGQERQDPRLINPMDTIRGEDQVGPNAPVRAAQVLNFTEPDSATAQAGLTPIVVPVPTAPAPEAAAAVEIPPVNPSTEQQFGLDKLRMGATNVSTGGAVDAQPSVGGVAGGDQLGGGLDVSRPDVAGAAGAVRGRTGGPATDAGQALAAGDGAAQQGAGVTPQGYNNAVAQPVEQWFGRKGDGYTTEADARQALPGRQRMFKDLEWKIEPMPNGKFRLAGYEPRIETPGVAGEKIDEDWTQFAPESGTRGIPRAEMPQVKSNQRGALVNFLDARGITSTQEEVPASELKPTQAEFSPAKVKSAKDFPYGDRSILVSSDNHVVDGHHQWLAKLDANEPVKIIRLSAPIDEVIGAVREFPSSTTAEGATFGTQAPQAQQTETQGQEAAGAGAIAAAGPAGAPAQLQGGRVPGLTPAPTAPLRDFTTFQKAVAADGIEIAPLRAAEMNTQHQIASAVARVLGKTYTVARVTSGDPMALSNGMIDKLGGKHIVAAENSDDAPLFVAIHEAYHGLPQQQRKALNTQLLQLFRTENKDRFLKEFNYNEAQFEEEAPAFIAQVVSKRADFWEELRTKMGNREFADVAKLVLGTLNQIVRKVTSQYGKDFADTYITDIIKARDLLTTAYAEAMREQGLKSDVEADTAVMASQRSEIGAKLQQRIDTDFDGAAQEYAQLKGTKGGRVLDTDIARELSPEYQQDRTRSAEVHEAASDFIQRNFERRLSESNPGDGVVFMAGGGGSGKSSAETLLAPILDKARTIYDGTLSSYDKAERNVQMALDAGQRVTIAYVYREPEEALRNGVLTRAMRAGRTVPIDALVKGHAGSSEVVRRLQEKFGDNPRFRIRAVDNSRGPGGAVLTDLNNITPVIKSGLKERFENATREEFEAGRISEAVYRGTTGRQADARAGAESAPADGAGRQGVGRDVQERRGSERAGDEVTRSNKASKETAADHKLTITREERELADKTKLTRDELAKIKESSQRFNLPPRMVEMEVRRIKSRFPESAGWAPLEFLRVDPKVMEKKAKEGNPLPSDAIFFVEQPYQFHLDPKAGKDAKETHDQRVKTMASALAGEIMEKYMAAQRGDPVAKIIMRQSDWYRALRSKLRSTFGGFGDFFAQLLGPTSANNPVEPNFKYAVEALKMATSGKWDNMFKEIAAWRADIDAAAANLDAVIATVKAAGGKAVMSDPRVLDAQKALKEAAVYKGTLPKRENGKMFGMATMGIVQILGERWGDKQMGDAPKTKNYYQNIVGRTIDATIDVWAARTLRRLANDTVGNFPRIPTVAEGAVAGNVLADNVTSGSEFGFGQEVFREAADELRASGIEQFRDTTPDAVQAMIWFAEKELWARRGWTSKIGEEGSIEHELLLAGYANREQVDKWRSAARAGKPNPDAKAFQLKDAEKAKQKYEKAVGEWSEAKRVAEEMLAQIERYPDRFVGGITLEIPNDKPTNSEMAAAERELDETVGDDQVIAKRAQTTTGEFMGDVERTIDLEFVVRNGYNPTPVWSKLVEISDREGQMATFLSRTLRADELENIDYTRHRPGIELYFAKPISKFDAAAMMAVINNAGVHGMTLATEGRKTVSSQSGEEQPIVGIRLQHIPEFMLGYGYEADFTDAIIEQNILAARDKMTALVDELDKRADISTVTRHWYETKVHFYGINERTAAAGSAEGDRGVWAGQSIREGLADAARFARENQDALGTRRAELLRERAVSRGNSEQGSVRRSNRTTGPAELARGPGARSDEGAGRTVTGIHYGKTAGLSRLSGTAFGSGIKGAEQARLNEPGVDPRIKKRVYFYLTNNNADMPRPEIGLGSHVYRATLGNMFDMAKATPAEKARVQSLRKTSDANGFESAILDAGYRGYVNREMQTAVVLNADVPVAYEGMADGSKMRDRVPERTAQAVATRTEGNELVRKPTNDEMIGIIKARPALAEAAPSFKLQFGEARVLASEAAEADRVLANAGAGFQFGEVMRSNRVTDTPAFKRWFGDSKVVDENGEPLVVYHGTTADFDTFDLGRSIHFERDKGKAFFYSSTQAASDYAEGMSDAIGGSANVMPVYLSIKRPHIINVEGSPSEDWDMAGGRFEREAPLRTDGYIVNGFDYNGNPETMYVVINPEQIKSATGNEGTFDPENPSILKSNRARQDAEVVKMFEDLQNARGLKLIRSQEAIADHPMGEQIAKIHNDFYDILERLDEAGLIEINCK